MIPRNPRITFEDALPHWAPNHSFAQITNAGSTSLPNVETYLNKVVARAALEIEDDQLKEDMRLFMAQEGNHYRQHRLFNKTLYTRYPKLKVFEDELGRDYERMLARTSLKMNAAYCEGFESTGIIYAEFFFEQIDDLTKDADQRLVKLWRWHLAEEFEHRTVCFDIHNALGGGYFRRILGFIWASIHLGRYSKRVSEYMLSVDRETMTPEQRRESIRLEKQYSARLGRFVLPHMLKVFSPRYNPRTKRAPRGSFELLSEIAAAGGPQPA
ncbi:metal-dependent hydrolase [Sphingomonas sp. KC8]|uniref:metal-dependent hydrolase n=1 Tax=Sphingomonas sp. KC8 TaxID=1030157 RepID=UPI0002488687|nr:metal-dependent hydrolase [Sphingomonas sp. KC8]ARS28736.1 metal-dependent hydrolase [Sphingomonas sp. KC8]